MTAAGSSWPGGSAVWCGVVKNLTLTPDEKGAPAHIQAIVPDITTRKRIEGEPARRAVHDPLTDLPNRALLADRLTPALTGAGAHPRGRWRCCSSTSTTSRSSTTASDADAAMLAATSRGRARLEAVNELRGVVVTAGRRAG